MGQNQDSRRISQEALCEIAGITISRRREWAKKKQLRAAGRAGYEERDAVELAVLRALVEALGPTDATVAWRQIKPILEVSEKEANLVALYDFQDKEASLEISIEGLRRTHSYGHKTAVVDLADPIGRIKIAFRRLTEEP